MYADDPRNDTVKQSGLSSQGEDPRTNDKGFRVLANCTIAGL
jgi:hypothetical protein